MTLKKRRNSKNIVIWSVDPFEKENAPSAKVIQDLNHWVSEEGGFLQPVHVLQLPPSELERGVLSTVEKIQDSLLKYTKKFKLKNVLPPEVLIDESDSRSGAVRTLLAYANKINPAWIALSSRGHSGLKRMVFGSFAEALLREASQPVLFLSKSLAEEAGSILFPTDFSAASRRAFRAFLPIARKLKLDVVIFHAITLPMPVYSAQMEAVPAVYLPENYYSDQKAWAKGRAEAWVKAAKDLGVKVRVLLSDQGVGPLTGNDILKAAKSSGADMIAMASLSGPIDRMLIGSAAQEVFRANKYPVWMFGPKIFRKRAAVISRSA